MKNCQACRWSGETDHTCPNCGGQDWAPDAPAEAPPETPPEPKPVPAKKR